MSRSIVIISGEGEVGTVEPYDGALTESALKERLTKERAGGDRWARLAVEIDDDPEHNDGIIERGIDPADALQFVRSRTTRGNLATP